MCTGNGVLWAKFLFGVESLFERAAPDSLFKSSSLVLDWCLPGLILFIPVLLSLELPLL